MKVRFHRGFLDQAELAQNAAGSPETWARAAADPRLATLRVLEKGNGNQAHYQSFALSPAAADLRWVEVPSFAFLEALATGPVRAITTLAFPKQPNRKALSRIATSGALPHARTLGMPDGLDLDELVGDLVHTRLAELIEGLELYPARTWQAIQAAQALPLERLTALVSRLPRLRVIRIDSRADAELTLTRGEAGWSASIVDPSGWSLANNLARLPPGLVHLDLSSPHAPPAERLAATLGCTVSTPGVET